MSVMTYLYPDAIVSTEWLADNLSEPSLRVFDCTVYLHYETGTGRPYKVVSGRSDYDAGHIPGSAFIDLQKDLSDGDSPYRFTMLPLDELARRFGALGIGDGTRAILYSRDNIQWSTRIWWMLRAVGFDAAAILDGGWTKWALENRPETSEERRYEPVSLTPQPRPDLFVGRDPVLSAIGDAAVCTINALAPDLHSGENARYGRPGRVPGSVNVPARGLLDPKTLALPTAQSALDAFEEVGADRSKRSIVYCGGGIAATLDAFLMHQLGYENIAVYDNSMSEWASDETLPIEVD